MINQEGLTRRLSELEALDIIDSGLEAEYDQITRMASYVCETPIALITLLTDTRQYFKSHHGTDLEGTPIEESFCCHAIEQPKMVMVVEDARTDLRFTDNPLVSGEEGVVFYAGAPIVTKSGVALGTLCVVDHISRSLNDAQLDALKTMANHVVTLLELRRTKVDLKHSQLELAGESTRLRNIIEATHVGTWEWNIESGQVFINDRYAEIAGYSVQELEPINIDMWYKLIHPDDQLLSDTKIKECFDRKAEYYDIECRLVHKNGHSVWVNDRGRVVKWSDDGKPVIMAGTHTDITDKKTAELRLSLTLDSLKERIKEQTCLYRISKLYESTVDIEDLMAKAADIIPSGWRYPSKAHARISLGGKEFTSKEFRESSVKQECSRYTINGDVLQLTLYYDPDVAELQDAPFLAEEWDLIRVIVDNLVLFNDRKLTDLQIAQNERRYRSLVENGADAVAIIGADGSTKYISPSITGVLGYSEDEALSMNVFDIVHPDNVEAVKMLFMEVLEKPGVPVQGHTSRILHKDGTWRWIEATATNLIHDPVINGIVDNFRDVTDRVITNKLDLLERMVMELSTDIQFELTELLHKYASGLEEIIPNTLISVHGVVDGKLTLLAAPSLPDGYICKVVGESIGDVAGSCGTAAYRKELVIVEDIETDPLWANYKELALSYGLKACWSQPIIDSEKSVVATIANYYTTPKLPGPFELDVFRRSAGLISMIMESYKKNQELLASNERYYFVNQATNDAIYDWDVTKDTFEWGESFTRIFGYELTINPFRLKDWETLVHPEDVEHTDGSLADFLADPSRHIWKKEYRFRKSDGTYAHVEEKGYLIRDDLGHSKRMIGVLRDQTVRREQEEAMKQLNQMLELHAHELAASNHELEQFAYIASHDLQEPLRMVTSFLTQLDKKYGPNLDDKAKKYIFYAVDGAKRMRQIILDLLEYSRVGKYEHDLEDIALNDLLDEVLHLDQSLIVEKKATVTIANLPTVVCYRAPLIQVFHNLIVNAIKYHKPDVRPHIEISSQDKGEGWMISVKDNGIGISAEYFDKIFVIFQRLHSPGEYAGTGLGLAIVKKVVESLGGQITVESEVGIGSTFSVIIPKRLSHPKAL